MGYVLRGLNALFSLIVLLCFFVVAAYAGYALWDNSQVYAAAENVRDGLLQLKPPEDPEGEEGPTFEDLKAINPDVCAWVTLDNTNIDHPVVQGQDNLTYVNRDVYGNFALAGSIFLDSRNDSSFSDPYSLLYGHHMENSGMFGDLALYKEEDFFQENSTGYLITPEGVYDLEIFASLVVSASDQYIFDPEIWHTEEAAALAHVKENALYLRENIFQDLDENSRILALSTCSGEFSDARTVVLAKMIPRETRKGG